MSKGRLAPARNKTMTIPRLKLGLLNGPDLT